MRRMSVTLFGCSVLWAGFVWLRYEIADARIGQCLDLIFSTVQGDICTRHALEERDAVLIWGMGIPLALLLATQLFAWFLCREANKAVCAEEANERRESDQSSDTPLMCGVALRKAAIRRAAQQDAKP